MKQKVKKYGWSRALCVLTIIVSVLVMCAYGLVQLFAVGQMKQGDMPHISGKTYIAVVDEQFSDKIKKNALVLGSEKESYEPGNIVAVRLNESNLVTVQPNTCADIAVVQIISASDATYSVAYNDAEQVFYVSQDAVLCSVNYQLSSIGVLMVWMTKPMAFLFWLVLPVLLIVLCAVILAYLREKYLSGVASLQTPITKVKKPKEDKKAQEKESEPKQQGSFHPLLSGEETEPSFTDLPEEKENAALADEISRKLSTAFGKDEQNAQALNEQIEKTRQEIVPEEEPIVPQGKAPAAPKTTVVYQVGEQKAAPKQEESVSEDDLDLMLLQDKIENIIHNNNRRLENEVEQKLRGLSTEKERAQRELEKTREFFISPAHLESK